MPAPRYFQFGWLALVLTSCSQSATSVDYFGQIGKASSGPADARFAIGSVCLQQGDRMTVVLLAEHPGKTYQPASLFFLKLTSKNSFATDGEAGRDDDKTCWHQKFAAGGDQKFPIRYEILHKPVAEQITLGDQARSLAEGRVFLMDPTAQPVQVTQLQENLSPLLPGQNPGREDLKGAIDKLKEKHDGVRTFAK